jgi:glycosyltransferase involved in cell wall biosynthesis
MIDLLYVTHNRLRFVEETWPALVRNTNWGEVARLLVADDGSTDGTAEYLERQDGWSEWCNELVLERGPFGGPVAAMNLMLNHRSDGVDMFAKVDDDFVVCPGWLDELLGVAHLYPHLDVIGTEPFVGDPTMPPMPGRGFTDAAHIGGKGLIRARAFERCRPVPNGRYGWTAFQTSHSLRCGWVTPDMPCFGIDQLPEQAGPWRGWAVEYERQGVGRTWPCYSEASHDYWDWWLTPASEEEAAA